MKKKLTVPTILTLGRIVLVVPFVILLVRGTKTSVLVALAIFIVAALSDLVDGFLARKLKQVTDLGAFLDPLADKMLVNAAFICLAVMRVCPYWVPIIFVCRDFAVDGVRMMMARKGETVSAGILGKVKTAVQMLAFVTEISLVIVSSEAQIVQFYVWFVGMVSVYLAVSLSILSGVQYLYDGIKRF